MDIPTRDKIITLLEATINCLKDPNTGLLDHGDCEESIQDALSLIKGLVEDKD